MKWIYNAEPKQREWRLIIEGLNRLRNKLIADGGVDDGKGERTVLKYEWAGDYYPIAGDDEP